jgi:hypothetical protein
MAHTNDRAGLAKPLTLAIDIGGSHLKAAVLNASGKVSTDPVRIKTPKPATPYAVVAALISLSQQLGQFDRVSIGFPGVVRADFVLTAPNLGTKEWHGFKLGAVLAEALGKPVRMLNDVDEGWPRKRRPGCGVSSPRSKPTMPRCGCARRMTLFAQTPAADHRTIRSKGCLSNNTALAMVFKLVEGAQKTSRHSRSGAVPPRMHP